MLKLLELKCTKGFSNVTYLVQVGLPETFNVKMICNINIKQGIWGEYHQFAYTQEPTHDREFKYLNVILEIFENISVTTNISLYVRCTLS